MAEPATAHETESRDAVVEGADEGETAEPARKVRRRRRSSRRRVSDEPTEAVATSETPGDEETAEAPPEAADSAITLASPQDEAASDEAESTESESADYTSRLEVEEPPAEALAEDEIPEATAEEDEAEAEDESEEEPSQLEPEAGDPEEEAEEEVEASAEEADAHIYDQQQPDSNESALGGPGAEPAPEERTPVGVLADGHERPVSQRLRWQWWGGPSSKKSSSPVEEVPAKGEGSDSDED